MPAADSLRRPRCAARARFAARGRAASRRPRPSPRSSPPSRARIGRLLSLRVVSPAERAIVADRRAGLDVAPFVATRYADPERLAAYTAPAYDLIEPAERARLTSADPRSIVHLTLPTFGAEDAAARLAAWRADGTLAVDAPVRAVRVRPRRARAGARHAGMGRRGRASPRRRSWRRTRPRWRPSSPTGGPCAMPPTPTWSRWSSPTTGRRGPRRRWPAGSSPNGCPTPTSPTTRASDTGCGGWPTRRRSPPFAPISPPGTR